MSNLLVKIREVTQIVTIRINFCDLIIIHFINADECMKNQIVHGWQLEFAVLYTEL